MNMEQGIDHQRIRQAITDYPNKSDEEVVMILEQANPSQKFLVNSIATERKALAARKTLLVEKIRLTYEKAVDRQMTPGHTEVLNETPFPELKELLEEMLRRNCQEVADYCIDTIYKSKDRRILEERREFEASTPPAKVEWP